MRLLGLKPVDSIYRNILMYTEYQSDGTVEHSILYIPFIQESFIPDPDRDWDSASDDSKNIQPDRSILLFSGQRNNRISILLTWISS